MAPPGTTSMTNVAQFTRVPDLCQEIRDHIWSYVVENTSPSTLAIRWKRYEKPLPDEPVFIRHARPLLSVLLVDRKTRKDVQDVIQHKQRYKFSGDSNFLSNVGEDYYHDMVAKLDYAISRSTILRLHVDIDRIEQILNPHPTMCYCNAVIETGINYFPNLKTLIVNLNDRPWYRHFEKGSYGESIRPIVKLLYLKPSIDIELQVFDMGEDTSVYDHEKGVLSAAIYRQHDQWIISDLAERPTTIIDSIKNFLFMNGQPDELLSIFQCPAAKWCPSKPLQASQTWEPWDDTWDDNHLQAIKDCGMVREDMWEDFETAWYAATFFRHWRAGIWVN